MIPGKHFCARRFPCAQCREEVMRRRRTTPPEKAEVSLRTEHFEKNLRAGVDLLMCADHETVVVASARKGPYRSMKEKIPPIA